MSIFKRTGSQNWQTEIVVNGNRVSRSTGTADRRAADRFERDLRDALKREAKTKRPRGQLTIDAACGRYWIEHGHRLRDAANVKRWLQYIVRWMDTGLLLSELGNRHVNELRQTMMANAVGRISQNRTIVTLQGVHNRAAKVWEEPTMAVHWGQFKTKEHARIAHITPEQARALLDAMPIDTARLVHFLLATGMRKREAVNLTWDHVKPDRVTITAKGGIVRDVALGPDALAILAECPRDGRYVFDATNSRKRFDAAKVEAGVPALRWHDLRHTAATWLGQSGADMAVIQQQLGHSSIAVTNKYRHVIETETRAALDRLPRLSAASKVVALRR